MRVSVVFLLSPNVSAEFPRSFAELLRSDGDDAALASGE
jgi:hypothetical protein